MDAAKVTLMYFIFQWYFIEYSGNFYVPIVVLLLLYLNKDLFKIFKQIYELLGNGMRSAVQYVRTCGIICDHLSICNAYCNCVMCTVCVTLYIYIGYVNICFTVLHSTYSFPTPYHLQKKYVHMWGGGCNIFFFIFQTTAKFSKLSYWAHNSLFLA